jgi:hypothetical protein
MNSKYFRSGGDGVGFASSAQADPLAAWLPPVPGGPELGPYPVIDGPGSPFPPAPGGPELGPYPVIDGPGTPFPPAPGGPELRPYPVIDGPGTPLPPAPGGPELGPYPVIDGPGTPFPSAPGPELGPYPVWDERDSLSWIEFVPQLSNGLGAEPDTDGLADWSFARGGPSADGKAFKLQRWIEGGAGNDGIGARGSDTFVFNALKDVHEHGSKLETRDHLQFSDFDYDSDYDSGPTATTDVPTDMTPNGHDVEVAGRGNKIYDAMLAMAQQTHFGF